jgi:hypothetical protein
MPRRSIEKSGQAAPSAKIRVEVLLDAVGAATRDLRDPKPLGG